MTRVAFLTAACMLPGAAEPRADAFEHALEFAPLRAGCAARGIELLEQVWDAPDLDPRAFDACVVGTTWDYMSRRAEFETRLAELAAARPLFNPLEVLRWNLDKRYLGELAARGAPVVPTRELARVDAASVARAFEELGTDELVLKPRVGAGAWRQARVRRGAPLPPAAELPPAEALAQPYLPGVAAQGEVSLVFLGGQCSHAVRKRPAAGDYRVQSLYGAREEPHTPRPAELDAARAVLAAVPAPLLYARVDLVPGPDDSPLLMELELVEPYLYPEQGPELGPRFAAALERMLTAR